MAEESKDPDDQPLSDIYDSQTLEQILTEIRGTSDSAGNGMDIVDEPALTGTITESCTPRGPGSHSNGLRQCTMEVNVLNRMTRFRYDTELNNRNIGKEELVSVKFINIHTETYVRIHCIDPSNKKAHPYCLIGDKCKNGVYCEKFTPSAENKCTMSCKATIKIPKRGEYEAELTKRKQLMEKHLGIFGEDMKKVGYWNMNKSVKECKCVALLVEAFYKEGQQMFMLQKETEGLLNAKDGRSFSVYTIRPFAHYCTGSKSQNENMLVILTGDSFIPKGIEIIFEDNEGWCVRTEKPTIIKNVLEVKIPPYKNTEIEEPKVVKIIVRSDSKVNLQTKPIEFMYKPDERTVIESKKRKRTDYSNIPQDILSETGANLAKSRMKSHLEQKKKKTSRPSATITAPQPSDGDRVQDLINTAAAFDPSASLDSNFDVFAITSTAPSFPAVLVPSNVPFTSPTQPGFMESSANQSNVSYGNDSNMNHQSTSSMYQMPIPSPQAHLSSPASQIHMPGQSPQNLFPLQSQQNVAPHSVTSPQPPPSPLSNMGKFKTVAIAGTNQWLLIDQFGKPLLVLGGQNDEVSAVQELPSLNPTDYVNDPSQSDMPSTYLSMDQSSAAMLPMNPHSTTPDNDLEVDDAGENADAVSTSNAEAAESSEKAESENSASSLSVMVGEHDKLLMEEDVEEATLSMDKMSLELQEGNN